MARTMWKLILVTLLLCELVDDRLWAEARSSGTNVDAACANMVPLHSGLTPQTSPPPYKITFTPASYTPGTPVTVTIEACTSTPFKGFMIQARRAVTASDQTQMLGSFTAVSGTQQTCSGNGLIHTSSADKTTLTFQWNPPAAASGPVQFWVTFVQSFNTVWAAVKSQVLLDSAIATPPQPSTVTTPTTLAGSCTPTPVASGKFAQDSDCGGAKTCFSDCVADGCTFEVSFRQVSTNGEYTLKTTTVSGSADMYAAVGFSTDMVMGSDSVTGCIYNSGVMSIFNAKNTGKVKPAMLASTGVTLKANSVQNGVFTCTFDREIAAGLNGDRFDLGLSYYLLFAKGPYVNNDLTFHSFKQPSSQQYSLTGSAQTAAPPVTQPPLTGDLAVPSDCGISLGCLSKCSGSCDTVITWRQNGANGVYTVSSVVSAPSSFIAVGFSSDNEMGGDSVTGCASNAAGNVVVWNAENTGKREPSYFQDSEVTLISGSYDNNVLSCSFRRPVAAGVGGKRFDLSKKWFILFARGSATVTTGALPVKVSFHGNNMFASSGSFAVSDTPNDGASTPDFPRIKAHGSLMIAAWIFFASLGIVVARYYKPVWKNDLCSEKVWFQIHRTCMVLVLCTTVAGFILIFVEVEELSDLTEDHKYLESHPVLGIVVTILTVLNPLMALIRPHPGTTYRPVFNWAHWFVGTSAHILGVITIFFGVQLRKAQVPDYMVYIVAGFVGWQVVIQLVLELLQCSCREKARQEMYEMTDLQNQPSAKPEESNRSLVVKRVILVLHLFVLTSVSAILIAFIAVGEDDL